MSAKIIDNHDSNDSSKDEVDFVCTTTTNSNLTLLNNNQKELATTETIPSPASLSQLPPLPPSAQSTTTTTTTTAANQQQQKHCPLLTRKLTPGTLYGDCEVKTSIKSSLSTLEKLSFFTLHRRHSTNNSNNNNNNSVNNNNFNNNLSNSNLNNVNNKSINKLVDANHHKTHGPKNKFVKSASIARLLGNTYSTKKIENELMKLKNNQQQLQQQQNNQLNVKNIGKNCIKNSYDSTKCLRTNFGIIGGIRSGSGGNGSRNERFQKSTKLEDELSTTSNVKNIGSSGGGGSGNEVHLQDFQEHQHHLNDISSKAFRTISRSLGKLWWKRTHSIDISQPDPEFKVSYLGNVLTGWAKGEGCVEKPLNTLWRNYTLNHKPDVIMRIRVCASGLKATTRQHGLTEYWANRITHCCSPKNYPKVFCWIYRHEGRKLKHELRCHAVLCGKESIAQDICNTLRENLDRALADFKREKILRQNARLSLANSVYENPSLPRRKILLSVGGNNYRPPLERSKSAPKLMAIEEAIGEEDGEEIEQTNEPEMPACCQKDSLYPAMTLGRRRCRRGHSIRRTGKPFKCFGETDNGTGKICIDGKYIESCCKKNLHNNLNGNKNSEDVNGNATSKSNSSLTGSDEDDLDKLLNKNNYDTSSPLAGELLSYFDMKMHAKTSDLIMDDDDDDENEVDDDEVHHNLHNLDDNEIYDKNNPKDYDEKFYEPSLTTDPSPCPRPSLSLDNLDNYSDVECGNDFGGGITTDEYDDDDDEPEDQLYYRQTAILNLLHRNSLRKLANLSMSSDDSSNFDQNNLEHNINNDTGANEIHRNPMTEESNSNVKQQQHTQYLDSDEGSISSGCETASTVTTNQEESSLKYLGNMMLMEEQTRDEHVENQQIANEKLNSGLVIPSFQSVNQRYLNAIKKSECNNNNNNNNDELKVSSSTLTFKLAKTSARRFGSIRDCDDNLIGNNRGPMQLTEKQLIDAENHSRGSSAGGKVTATRTDDGAGNASAGSGDVSDSEFSDESGYVEYQDQCGVGIVSHSDKNTLKKMTV